MRLPILVLLKCLPYIVTASQTPLQYDAPHNSAIESPQVTKNLTVSDALFRELEELARIVDIAYCVGVPGSGIQQPFQCLSRCKDFESFELVTSWNTGPLMSDSCGYIALSHEPAQKRIIVAFRGTYSITNTIADLSTWPQEYIPYPGGSGNGNTSQCGNCSVHMGFYESWENTRNVIGLDVKMLVEDHPDYQLVLVGHSLGGAVAALAGLEFSALDLKPIVTTFGEPKLGNQAFADHVNKRFRISLNGSTATDFEPSLFRRVTHMDDPVPLLPLESWGYQPHGGEVFISKSDLSPERSDIRHCAGNQDASCSMGGVSLISASKWTPSRLKLWQILFAHRDYFWRLGLCVPDLGWWWPKEPNHEHG